ncbi:MAG: LysR family transcriptional regulator [Anaerolineales bacterium]|uniref:LysR family transcriptional regulator n=1 Tax=Candidatus Villigracilis vicinus TaxID=3140679 RepID=UPI0031362484|nr:LysR family transcriptional regulator [Anaerolineales bacterium]
MLDLNSLKVFLAIAEHGNFSEAGRRLHLSQPAVSQIVQGLERVLGAQLFIRQGRATQLTEAGQLLIPMARELLTSSQRVEQTMLSLQDDVIGEMTVGCSTASGKYLLPGIIARFRREFPQVRINVLVTSRESVINKLLNGDVCLGVTSKQVEHSDLEYKDFFRDDVILIVPVNHRWAQYRKIYPDDLLDEPMILREEVAGTREVLMEGLREHDISYDMLNIDMVLGNAEAIEMAVEEGIGIAFVSRLAATRGLELGKVVEVEVEGMNLTRNIYLARNRKQLTTRGQEKLWQFVTLKKSEPQRNNQLLVSSH